MYEVLNPCGESTVGTTSVAPRLSNLNGKTIGEIWNGTGKGEIVFPIIREMMKERYPDVKLIPYTDFPIMRVIGETTQEVIGFAEAAVAAAVKKGCDAIIAGVGS